VAYCPPEASRAQKCLTGAHTLIATTAKAPRASAALLLQDSRPETALICCRQCGGNLDASSACSERSFEPARLPVSKPACEGAKPLEGCEQPTIGNICGCAYGTITAPISTSTTQTSTTPACRHQGRVKARPLQQVSGTRACFAARCPVAG
jgi:hypothetical protein